MKLDVARDLWAARYGYEWHTYALNGQRVMPELLQGLWHEVLQTLQNNACLDIDYTAGQLRLKEWKS